MVKLSDLLSATQAAAYLGISRARIYELLENGMIQGQIVAGRRVFTRQELDTWNANKKPGRPRSFASRRTLALQRAKRSES